MTLFSDSQKFIQSNPLEVAEIPGLLGPLAVPELWVQREWHRGRFCHQTFQLGDGRIFRILQPGRWNRLEGPDFLNATLEIDGEKRVGDVEIHWRREDWNRHGHNLDMRYAKVILHAVVLFAKDHVPKPLKASGDGLNEWILGPFLDTGVESMAEETQLLESCGYLWEPVLEHLLALEFEQRILDLKEAARSRWAEKCRYSALRQTQVGLNNALHLGVCSVLGYPRNRAAFMALAERYPYESWANRSVEFESLWKFLLPRLKLQGCRPANHPKKRLKEYYDWFNENADWPMDLAPILASALNLSEDFLNYQKDRKALQPWTDVFPGSAAWNGKPLWQSLWLDVFWPNLQAMTEEDLFFSWFIARPGNHPASVSELLKEARIISAKARRPLANGWIQGLYRLRE